MWQYNYTQYPDELYHYGRKGMKWGQHIFGKVRTSLGNRRARKAAMKEASKRERAENIYIVKILKFLSEAKGSACRNNGIIHFKTAEIYR